MKRKYWIIGAIVIVVAGVILWMVFGNRKNEKPDWRTAKVEKGDVQVTVRASGTLQAVTTVQVGTQVSGIIKKIYVDFNSVVREGEVIAVLDTIFLAQSVEDAKASLKRAQIQLNQARRDYDRTKILFEQKVMAQADYDLALSTYETAVANTVSAESSLNRAKINLNYATIVAPISGVVVSRAVDVGQTVAASFSTPTMFTIANDLTKMQVQANIDEGDIGKIKVEQDVTFTVDAYPELTFSGTVRQVRLQPVVSQNVVNYTVIIDVPNEELKLLPGMTANITVLIDESRDVLKVPATALRFTPSQDVISEMIKSAPDSVKKMMERWTAGGRQRNSGGQPGSQGSTGNAGSPDNRLQGGSPVQGPGLAQRGGTPGNPEMKQRPKMGLVWIREGETIRPRRVRTGLSDGTFTEVEGRNLKEGDEVILGMASQQTNQASQIQQQQNPFAPPRPPSGRGGR